VEGFFKSAGMVILGFLALLGMAFMFANAFDTSMDNKDSMLCESAKVSGNVIYLEKCTCYYGGENIRCIYREVKK
jgi:hypothetical protein